MNEINEENGLCRQKYNSRKSITYEDDRSRDSEADEEIPEYENPNKRVFQANN